MKRPETRKEPVRLRMKDLKGGNVSLYLDTYVKGRRKREALGLYLIPEHSRNDRERNRETLRIAELQKAKRLLDLQSARFHFGPDTARTDFFSYYRELMNGKNKPTRELWNSCLGHLRRYEKRDCITFADTDKEWAKGFVDYLHAIPGMSQNTISTYTNKLRCCFNRAVREGIIRKTPFADVRHEPRSEREREYLTKEEVAQLARTPCGSDIVRRAFLFSCLTGLRYSDIRKLTWREVHAQGDFTRLIFRQKKTGGQEYLDLNRQAVSLMGQRRGDDEPVFGNVPTTAGVCSCLRNWTKAAGITKHITFHCARHTFAVMMLDLGVDIYTVSKLLGHRELKTTQIYAKILDKNKQKAVAMIPDLLGE